MIVEPSSAATGLVLSPHTLSTKLSTTRFSSDLSKRMVSLLPSTAVTLPLPNFWVETRAHAATGLNVIRPPSFDLPRRGRTVISIS